MQAMDLTVMSQSQVSELAKELDWLVTDFRY